VNNSDREHVKRPADMTEYVLSYGQPRVSPDAGVVIYEAKRLRAECADNDDAAVQWARDVVPYECGLTFVGRQYLAAPMVLRRGQVIIWESLPGMALRAAV